MSENHGSARWSIGDFVARITALRPSRQEARPEPPRVEREDEVEKDVVASVPRTLRVGAAVSWRVLLVVAVVAGVVWLASRLQEVLLPVAIALAIAVFLQPLVEWLRRRLHFPPALAATVGLLLFFVVFIAALSQATNQIVEQVPLLVNQATSGVKQLVDWLEHGPIKVDTTAINNFVNQMRTELIEWVNSNKQSLATGALSITSSLLSMVTSGLTMLFCLFFFLKDGRSIWLWVVRLLPAPARVPLHESAIRGWVTLGSYVRTQIQVAAIDAVGISLGAFFLGMPMVVPIAVITFFAAFVPIIGALASGAIAVLVALVYKGATSAIIMLVIILVVQQVESNLLQPFMMSSAVSLHPVAVMLVITAAGSVGGIAGAVFGVPIAAFINATVLYLHGYDPMPQLATRADRPGGPPGMLDQMIADTYVGKPDTRALARQQVAEAAVEAAEAAAEAEPVVAQAPDAPAPAVVEEYPNPAEVEALGGAEEAD